MNRREIIGLAAVTLTAPITHKWGYRDDHKGNWFVEYECSDGGKLLIAEYTAGVEILRFPAEHGYQEWRIYVLEDGAVMRWGRKKHPDVMPSEGFKLG